jgi:hypothetical protein
MKKVSNGLWGFLGLLAIGICMVVSVYSFKSYERVVSVRGLCEKEVKADKVIWPIAYKTDHHDISEMYRSISDKNRVAIKFLKDAGIDESEITVKSPTINDASQYNSNARAKYYATSVIVVCTNKVDKVIELQSRQLELIRLGVPVGSGDAWEYKTEFTFNGLNDIKPAMIEEATANARAAAEKFAKDSKSSLGRIKNASQGQFSINNRDSNTPYIKNVRVVTNVTYYLN